MMLQRGTTPTIQYTFSAVQVTDIVECYLTVKQDKSLLFEKDLADATVGDNSLSWTLTQEETLLFKENGKISLQIRYKMSDGMAYASKVVEETAYRILKDGVI